jgi:hypothetical protein
VDDRSEAGARRGEGPARQGGQERSPGCRGDRSASRPERRPHLRVASGTVPRPDRTEGASRYARPPRPSGPPGFERTERTQRTQSTQRPSARRERPSGSSATDRQSRGTRPAWGIVRLVRSVRRGDRPARGVRRGGSRSAWGSSGCTERPAGGSSGRSERPAWGDRPARTERPAWGDRTSRPEGEFDRRAPRHAESEPGRPRWDDRAPRDRDDRPRRYVEADDRRRYQDGPDRRSHQAARPGDRPDAVPTACEARARPLEWTARRHESQRRCAPGSATQAARAARHRARHRRHHRAVPDQAATIADALAGRDVLGQAGPAPATLGFGADAGPSGRRARRPRRPRRPGPTASSRCRWPVLARWPVARPVVRWWQGHGLRSPAACVRAGRRRGGGDSGG